MTAVVPGVRESQRDEEVVQVGLVGPEGGAAAQDAGRT